MRIEGLTIHATDAAVPWRTTRHAGVSWLPLHVAPEGAERPEAVVLIRMEPGCGYPAHEHLDVEDVLLLQGGYRDELGEHRAGEYVRYPAGSRHGPVALGRADEPASPANPACLLFAVARGGVRLLEDRTSVRA